MPIGPGLPAAAELYAATASNRRFSVMGLLFPTVVMNYPDRSALPIAAPG
jgi:hypothetical protein